MDLGVFTFKPVCLVCKEIRPVDEPLCFVCITLIPQKMRRELSMACEPMPTDDQAAESGQRIEAELIDFRRNWALN